MNVENYKPTKDRSQNDSRLEVDTSVYQSTQPMDADPEETSYRTYVNCLNTTLRYAKAPFVVEVLNILVGP